MRYILLIIAVIAFIGCLIDTVPKSAITPTAMTETSVRVGIFYQQNNRLPADLSVLPVRNGYINRTTDAWNQPLEYTPNADGTFTLSSLGGDGTVGGTELNADLKQHYRIVDGQVEELP